MLGQTLWCSHLHHRLQILDAISIWASERVTTLPLQLHHRLQALAQRAELCKERQFVAAVLHSKHMCQCHKHHLGSHGPEIGCCRTKAVAPRMVTVRAHSGAQTLHGGGAD